MRGTTRSPGFRMGRLALLAVTALVVAATFGCQRGGAYPRKPVTLIMPLPAGSAPDVNFRVLAEEAKKSLGQEIVVVNRPGGGGAVGVTEVVLAKPDGYTVGMVGVAMVTVRPLVEDLPYKGAADMTPLLQVTEAPIVLSVRADAPWESAEAFVRAAKDRRDSPRVGMADQFSVLHVELERLQELSGAPFTIVPFGAGQQIPALLGGTVDAAVSQPTVILPHVQAGRARILGVFGDEPVDGLDVRTFKDQGYDIPQIPYEYLIAPNGTPPEILQKLHDSFKAAIESEAFIAQADKTKIRARYLSGPDLARKLEADARVYADIARSLNWGQQ